jgi:predicted aspartyl protease
MELSEFLEQKNYHSIKLEKNEIGHYQFQISLNGIDGNFILDTGASSSCIGTEYAEKYDLIPEISDYKAAGAGAIDMETFQAKISSLSIGGVKVDIENIILFDLTQINEALSQQNACNIDGIIGADILEQLSAVISYSEKTVYLKETSDDKS